MSHEASLWAWKASPKKSSHKFVLVAMAERAGEQALCWPSIKRLALDTLLNRKTIISALDSLVTGGFIEDTGERRGITNQVKVYRLLGVDHREDQNTETKKLNRPKNGTVKRKIIDTINSTENGTISDAPEQTQKRNSSKNGTVPLLPDKSPVFTTKESQKRDTESERNQKGTRSTDTDADAQASETLDGEFEVCELEQADQPVADDNNPDVQPGIFGSHLIQDCHPYLFWFLRDMEHRGERNPEAIGDFAERLVQFGLQGSYCRSSLNNFLRVRRESIDEHVISNAQSSNAQSSELESIAQDLIHGWQDREAEFIAEADECLADFREYLANQAA